MPPTISLVVPVHNPGPSLATLLQTATSQRCVDEIILVDDASEGGVWEAIEAHPDPRIKPFRFETNQGSSAARNFGLDRAGGDFVAMLDADDFYLTPTLLDMQKRFLEKHPDHIYVGSSYMRVRANGDFDQPMILAQTDTQIRWEALFSAPWLPSGCLMRRNDVRFDTSQRGCEDNDFFSELLEVGKGHNLREIGFGYLMNGGQSQIYLESNLVNLLRTNQSNLSKIGIEASFEDVLTLRRLWGGGDSQKRQSISQKSFLSSSNATRFVIQRASRSFVVALMLGRCGSSPPRREKTARWWRYLPNSQPATQPCTSGRIGRLEVD